MSILNKRQRLYSMQAQMENERATFLPQWRDCGDYILPTRQRYERTDVNRGDRRNQKIIDSTGTSSARTLRSGMMSGVTSPARPWFRLTTQDPDMALYGPVKQWLHAVTQSMRTGFVRSNLYTSLPSLYSDMGVFGTGCMLVEENPETAIRTYTQPIGSYMISNNDMLKVDCYIRELSMTVRQVVEKFGRQTDGNKIDWSNMSDIIKNAWENSEYETWISVVHAIYPNPDWDPRKSGSKYKKYASCYYERGTMRGSNNRSDSGTEQNKFLRESGYDYFPVLAPRWGVTGEDVYGTDCPGFDSIGDVKALQTMHKRKAQAIEKGVRPPMVGPTSLRQTRASILPGEITYTDEREGQRGFRPAHEVNLSIRDVVEDIREHQQRIKDNFFTDIFLMLSNSDRRQITATEIDERREEKLLILGPVLEKINDDLLDPLIDIQFNIMNKQGLIPEPPPELQGQDLKVEYISIMAQAQRMIGLGGIDRFFGFAGQAAAVDPSIVRRLNVGKALNIYADDIGISPDIIRTDEEVEEIEQAEAQAQQQQAMMNQIPAAAAAAKDLSQAEVSDSNLLGQIAGGVGQ